MIYWPKPSPKEALEPWHEGADILGVVGFAQDSLLSSPFLSESWK
jgi:hypothetical protein